jgi:rhodanese-related sulfurtransferase
MDIQKPVIIHALWQIPMILLIAIAIGLGFNQFRSNRLPLVCKWGEQQAQDQSVISITEAARLFQENKAVFLDARPVEFYDKGHIQGALSLPWQKVDEQCMEVIDKIPPDCTIITYCDGPACDLSHMLANFMKDMGFEDVRALVNGWTLWNQKKLPVEGSDHAGGRP